ncbi:MAG: XdhC family protein, partial [Gemmatimonadaceae bacterium]
RWLIVAMRAESHPTPPIAGDGTSLSAILQAVNSARSLRPSIQLAMATLVGVEGSSYRQPGARLLIDVEQRVLAGAISGGCLEGDVASRAADVCASNKPVMLRYDLREDLETIWGFGAGCDGIAHILLEPLQNDKWLRDAQAAMMKRSGAMLTTTIGASSETGRLGQHEVISALSAEAAAELNGLGINTAQPFVLTNVVDNDSNILMFEPLHAPVALHLIGAGRSAEAFATIAAAMGWQVTIIDHRETMLRELQLPATVKRLVRRAEQGIADLALDSRTAIALLTHIFEIDSAWLKSLLPHPVSYVGVLGSRNRASRLVAQLSSDGATISTEMHQRLFAPIGLDLGGESPESIALAGIAEMEAVLHARPGGFLRSRQSPIHTRTPVPLILDTSVDATIEECAVPFNQSLQ